MHDRCLLNGRGSQSGHLRQTQLVVRDPSSEWVRNLAIEGVETKVKIVIEQLKARVHLINLF
jgi:hypothetical protein